MEPGINQEGRSRSHLDTLADERYRPDYLLTRQEGLESLEKAFGTLTTDKRTILKLLILGEWELTPEEVRWICHVSGRSISQCLDLLADIEHHTEAKRSRHQEIKDQLSKVSSWIVTYQKRLRQLEESIGPYTGEEPNRRREKEVAARDELKRKLAWRYRQQSQVRERVAKARPRTAYKNIAKVLNVPMGTVCSQIARAREELLEAWKKIQARENPQPE
jgi:DNA-directed RNA polymerase specialized sigma24 family protein